MKVWPLFALFSLSVFAYEPENDQVLRFEHSPFKDVQLQCERDKHIVPKRSELQLDNYALLAADNGERVAIITLTNTAGGQRIFNQDHIVAVMADCARLFPQAFEIRLAPRQQTSLQIHFGRTLQPVLQLISSQ
ncbi:hypothetical protein [Rheinheimera maricola]|uniref:TonB C-terminal domain-containing protein n=1 Tax=Rheinheimera maricola TaxID=2793282 RepID=A0ABS7XDG8_9GAMM|nr:hypothetical protein [Rheinheimera maricola]MBZ9613199.1 hypothetical protein [Rheinheimera maricola]